MFEIEKKEIMYAIAGIVFLIFWVLFIRDRIAVYLGGMFPFWAMLIYNLGFFLSIVLLSSVLEDRIKQVKLIFISFVMYLGFSVLDTPFLVSKLGIINSSVDLWYTSSDIGFASLYSLFTSGNMVWVLTYVMTPFLLICLIPIIIAYPKIITKALP